jgi:hypothetical protein
MSRRNSIPGQFAWRLIEMLESPAYRALSHSAHRLLARLEIELAHHGGQQNGRLPLTYEQMVEYGIHRHAIAPAIREAAALGFLEVTERGRAANAESPSKYRLTYRHVGRANATDEWRQIKTDDEAAMIAKGARRTGSSSAPAQVHRKASRISSRKHFPGDGSRQFSVSKTITENGNSPVPESVTTARCRKPSLL